MHGKARRKGAMLLVSEAKFQTIQVQTENAGANLSKWQRGRQTEQREGVELSRTRTAWWAPEYVEFGVLMADEADVVPQHAIRPGDNPHLVRWPTTQWPQTPTKHMSHILNLSVLCNLQGWQMMIHYTLHIDKGWQLAMIHWQTCIFLRYYHNRIAKFLGNYPETFSEDELT